VVAEERHGSRDPSEVEAVALLLLLLKLHCGLPHYSPLQMDAALPAAESAPTPLLQKLWAWQRRVAERGAGEEHIWIRAG